MNSGHYAVVVGINRYPGIRDLHGARRDADDFAAWLTDPEGGAVPAENVLRVDATADTDVVDSPFGARPTPSEIEQALMVVQRRAKDSGLADDPERWSRSRLYLFLAGHGIAPQGGSAALLTADASLDRLGAHIEVTGYGRWYQECSWFAEVVIFADCCRNRFTSITARQPAFTSCQTTKGAVSLLIGYATALNDVAYEGAADDSEPDSRRGYFTRALLEALHSAGDPETGEITSTTIGPYLKQVVRDLSASRSQQQDARLVPDEKRPIVFRPAAAAGRPIQTSRVRVTMRFPASYPGGPVRLLDGSVQQVATWDPGAGPWTLELAKGFYQVEPAGNGSGPAVNPFKSEGTFKVVGADRDVDL